MNIVDFAHQILDMQDTIRALKAENEVLRKYKQDYISLLNSSTEHNDAMMTNILDALMEHGQKWKY